jgi:hypothetical protein
LNTRTQAVILYSYILKRFVFMRAFNEMCEVCEVR